MDIRACDLPVQTARGQGSHRRSLVLPQSAATSWPRVFTHTKKPFTWAKAQADVVRIIEEEVYGK
jgi:hypothetical protein